MILKYKDIWKAFPLKKRDDSKRKLFTPPKCDSYFNIQVLFNLKKEEFLL